MNSAARFVLAGTLVGLVPSACKKDEPKPASETQQAVTAAPAPKLALPEPPKNLGPLRIPPENPLTPEKVELGRRLFFDPRLSADGTRACYSCHQNEDGTGGHEPLAIGALGKVLPRHSPTLWNVAYLPRFYWDGRATSLEAQMKGAWAGGNMGIGEDKLAAKAAEIAALPEYKEAFATAFPSVPPSPDTVAQAVASYERTLFCGDTAWDRFMAGDKEAMNAEQKQGWDIFKGKAACHACHMPPFFSDAYTSPEATYYNVGIGTAEKAEKDVDVGRMKVTNDPKHWAAFKIPSLRNVAKSAPYFHDGSAAKLEDAVRLMAAGGIENKNRDPRLGDRKLTDEEIRALVAFLGALDCGGKLEPLKAAGE